MKIYYLPLIGALAIAAELPVQWGGNKAAVKTMGEIRLKDYDPDSSLVVPEHHPLKARFQVIDIHVHSDAKTPAEVAAWVRAMDEAGVRTSVVGTYATGAEFDRMADLFLTVFPGRFQLFCGLETKDFEAPDYPQRAAAELERCYRKGARGVGELIDKGSGLSFGRVPPRNRRLHPDDPRLDLFWRKCAELKMPVSLHIVDHPSAWRPVDSHQERSPRFQEFNQYGRDVPSYEELLAMRNRLLERNPETTFILCHLGNQGNDLAALSKVLDRFPNAYLDLSGRDYELGREPRTAARFLERYQDRVMFGTDMLTLEKMHYLRWWRLLETSDEYIRCANWWRLYGLDLPDALLEKIYRRNALRFLLRN